MVEPQYDAEDMHRYYDMKEFREMQKRVERADAICLAYATALMAESDEVRVRVFDTVRSAIAKAEGR